MDPVNYEQLLKRPPPSRRAAYSDRTAWLLAEAARLAYLKFEISQPELDDIAARISEITDLGDAASFLAEQLPAVLQQTSGREQLDAALNRFKFKVVKTFNAGGTQAYLARRTSDRIAVLAFRGTEVTQLADIKADLRVFTTNEGGALVHNGFQSAYREVQAEIAEAVAGLGNYSLYITGHSLGGALGLMAVKTLEGDNLAACYTYGCPRVGGSEFGESIKTPIYRIVNTADVVPRLPPGVAIELSVDVLRLLKEIVPFVEYIAKWLDDKVSGYRHIGDMRYLTSSVMSDHSDVDLIQNITFLARLRRLIKNRISLDRRVKDHAIEEYCGKLAAYAWRRTQG